MLKEEKKRGGMLVPVLGLTFELFAVHILSLVSFLIYDSDFRVHFDLLRSAGLLLIIRLIDIAISIIVFIGHCYGHWCQVWDLGKDVRTFVVSDVRCSIQVTLLAFLDANTLMRQSAEGANDLRPRGTAHPRCSDFTATITAQRQIGRSGHVRYRRLHFLRHDTAEPHIIGAFYNWPRLRAGICSTPATPTPTPIYSFSSIPLPPILLFPSPYPLIAPHPRILMKMPTKPANISQDCVRFEAPPRKGEKARTSTNVLEEPEGGRQPTKDGRTEGEKDGRRRQTPNVNVKRQTPAAKPYEPYTISGRREKRESLAKAPRESKREDTCRIHASSNRRVVLGTTVDIRTNVQLSAIARSVRVGSHGRYRVMCRLLRLRLLGGKMREWLGVGEEREGGRLYVATPDAATPDFPCFFAPERVRCLSMDIDRHGHRPTAPTDDTLRSPGRKGRRKGSVRQEGEIAMHTVDLYADSLIHCSLPEA
ncbi:hypothetical protein IMY05_C4511000900 [Salix suchowensis]|nr:hypothetical protein IMY05_C4511000900 [Salix suchowensis]